MFSIHHTSSGFAQSRTLGPVTSDGQTLDCRIDCVDPDFGIGGDAARSRWQYTYDRRGQIGESRKQRPELEHYVDIANWGWSRLRAHNDIGGLDGDNALNQTTSRETPWVWINGMAPPDQSVAVDGWPAHRVSYWWTRMLPRPEVPQWQQHTITAESAGLPAFSQTGHIYVPPVTEAFTYDDDGNQTSDARWLYHWDADNRLAGMTTTFAAAAAGVPELRLTFAYDSMSRRIQKKVELKVAGQWQTRNDVRFIYDGWNLMAEVEYHAAASDAPKTGVATATQAFLRRTYMWGPDVSGTMDGAGGVGGLLMVTRHERGTRAAESYWATADMNGNVIGLVSTTTPGRAAVYDYDAFGKLVRVNEPEEGLNPIRFSSKYIDVETGLAYYGYRYYSADLGRWLSRDPIGEEGGINLYGMVGNDPVGRWDRLGLQWENPGVFDNPEISINWNPFKQSQHLMVLDFKEDGEYLKQIQRQIYADLKRFAHFADPKNDGGAVIVSGSVAKFRGPIWPPAYAAQWVGSKLNRFTGLTFWNVVNLRYDDSRYMVTGDTVPGHILEGTRHWWVQKNRERLCSLIVRTSANERTAGGFNHLGRVIFTVTFGDLQKIVWDDYFANIGRRWKTNESANVTGP